MTQYRTKERHSPPSRARCIAGWIAVIAGIAMVLLPGPGLLTLVLGIILLGRRDPTLRRLSITLRRFLNRMSRSEMRFICTVGKFLRARLRQSRLFIGEELRRHAAGKSFSPEVQLMIGFALLVTLISLGAGAAMLISG